MVADHMPDRPNGVVPSHIQEMIEHSELTQQSPLIRYCQYLAVVNNKFYEI